MSKTFTMSPEKRPQYRPFVTDYVNYGTNMKVPVKLHSKDEIEIQNYSFSQCLLSLA